MPHPEHCVEEGYGPSTDGLGVLHLRPQAGGERVTAQTQRAALDTVDARRLDARTSSSPGPSSGSSPTSTQRIREILGRRPTSAELAMYSVMW